MATTFEPATVLNVKSSSSIAVSPMPISPQRTYFISRCVKFRAKLYNIIERKKCKPLFYAFSLPNEIMFVNLHAMIYEKTEIEGVYVITPKVFTDARGYFFESFKLKEFE